MRTADKQISDILVAYGEPFAGNVWRVQGTAVIYHKALERIAAQAGIRFDVPTIIRAERDECVMLVVGRLPRTDGKPERMEWSAGEALINVNYRVSGKQAAYVYAMAEKRAKDRVILKLIDLHGLVYSEEEADEFKTATRDKEDDEPPLLEAGMADLKKQIDDAATISAVTDIMLDEKTQIALAGLTKDGREETRGYAAERLKALGWKSKSPRRVNGHAHEVAA